MAENKSKKAAGSAGAGNAADRPRETLLPLGDELDTLAKEALAEARRAEELARLKKKSQ